MSRFFAILNCMCIRIQWNIRNIIYIHFPGGSVVKNSQAMQEAQLRSQDQEDPLEKEMTTHSSFLTWEIPWTEEPGGLCPWIHTRIRHNLVTKQHHIYIHIYIHINMYIYVYIYVCVYIYIYIYHIFFCSFIC